MFQTANQFIGFDVWYILIHVLIHPQMPTTMYQITMNIMNGVSIAWKIHQHRRYEYEYLRHGWWGIVFGSYFRLWTTFKPATPLLAPLAPEAAVSSSSFWERSYHGWNNPISSVLTSTFLFFFFPAISALVEIVEPVPPSLAASNPTQALLPVVWATSHSGK